MFATFLLPSYRSRVTILFDTNRSHASSTCNSVPVLPVREGILVRRIRAFLHRLCGTFSHSTAEQDLADEIESDLERHIQDNLRKGLLPEEARRQVILRFGGIENTKQQYRDRRGLPLFEMILHDLRYGARTLGRSSLFTAVAIATLGFGIGMSTTMFTVARAVLLRPLPFAQPDRLVAISEVDRLKPTLGAGANVASADFFEWQRANTVFSDMADYVGIDERGQARIGFYLNRAPETRILKGLVVTPNLFDVLGVPPLLGRGFAAKDDQVAILSYNCWQSQFAGDSHIVGRALTLSGVSRQLIGVMPRGFFFPNNEVEVFVPPGPFTPDRIFHDAGVIARLRPGTSLQLARAQMSAIGARLQRAFPETNATLDTQVRTLHSAFAASSRPALLMLFLAVAVLFVIVCSNVAHLQLARAASRIHEFTIRKALGAGRGRLVGQLLGESLLLSMAGGVLGLLIANLARAALLRFAPEAIPSYADLRIDLWVVLFNIAVTLLAPVLFGLAPSWSAVRFGTLGARGASSAHPGFRGRELLVALEMALSVVLVVSAGLLIRSFVRLENVDLGFHTAQTLSFRLNLSDFVSSDQQRAEQFASIERRLLEYPQVDAAGATARPLLGGGSGGEAGVIIRGRERSLRLELVTPGYFRAMRTPLLRGRFPNQSDTQSSSLIAIVNRAFERVYFPDQNAVGRQIGMGGRGAATIAGVVADLKQEGLDQPAQPAAFIPSTQITPQAVTFVVRGSGDRNTMAAIARAAVRSVNQLVPLEQVATLDDLVRASVSGPRIRTSVLSLLAVAALFLAALGLYGLLAYSVVQRSTEIGVRMALGASAQRLFGQIVVQGMRPVIAGAIFGLLAAYTAGYLMRSLLFGIVPADPLTYLLTTLVLAAVSLCSCAIPALRAIGQDPMVSLRQQ